MRCVLQRVTQAQVIVNQKTVGEIAHGFVLLLGVTHADTQKDVESLVEKIVKLRLFADPGSNTFMEKSIVEAGGSVLVVSQFTLYGDCSKGTRPSFTDAAKPDVAKQLYEHFVRLLREKGIKTETGEFGEHMEVSLVNDGPVTLMLESCV